MKHALTIFRVSLLTVVLLPHALWAGVVNIEPGAASAKLAKTAQVHTTAFQIALADHPEFLKSGKQMRKLRAKLRGQTIARVEYMHPGGTRVYHGRSGHSIRSTLASLKSGNRSSRPSEGTTTSGSDSETSLVDLSDDVAADAAEQVYYPENTREDARARLLPEEESVVQARDIGDGHVHAWDAEIKVFRTIENDIRTGVVLPGGKITGYVSKTICASCRAAIEEFAGEFDVTVDLYEMIEAGKDLPRTPTTVIEKSQASSRHLAKARKIDVDHRIDPQRIGNRRHVSWPGEARIDAFFLEESAQRATEDAGELAACDR
ncbi:hypothetical protein [Luteibacter yeojuensis]|uniref:Uncharacterized protein n=1 Tax=Luteibacter yeojuensis TaxID=345309 RepID=A0A7X5QVG2_9GAMM|nr:hypothetical protein [Luteibacter yeojuensis]NID16151.1 hypothetical protein [Luteibacter yeojuensis]